MESQPQSPEFRIDPGNPQSLYHMHTCYGFFVFDKIHQKDVNNHQCIFVLQDFS